MKIPGFLGRGMGMARGGIAGAAVGMAGAAAIGGAYINRNEKFFSESPYVGNRRLDRRTMEYTGTSNMYGDNTSSRNAKDLNADGNIVLGMHNLRRG